MCIYDCLYDLNSNLSKGKKILLLIISVITFLIGPILLGIHYEDNSIDIPIGLIVISFISPTVKNANFCGRIIKRCF